MQRIARLVIFFIAVTPLARAQSDSSVLHRISDQVLLRGECYKDLRFLCKTIGHRLSGSEAAAKAVQWGERTMRAAGADRVWTQPVDVPRWVRGQESLLIDFGTGPFYPVPVLSLGNSEGTGGKLLEEEVVAVRNFAEFDSLPDAAVRGKVVFFNYRFRQDLVSTFDGYSDAGPYRWRGPNKAAARGAKAVIVRSISTGPDDFPHTGSMRYADSVAHIPAVAIGNFTADRLERAVNEGRVFIRLTSECRIVDTVRSYNVVGEIRGTEKPEEILLVGGHLDSWDVGEGAHDDGAGCVQSIEVLRTFKALGLRPKRTVRAVLFMNEENGVRGGAAYADSAIAKGERHIFALESDAGGFSPRGFSVDADEGDAARGETMLNLARRLAFLNLHELRPGHGGTDIDPLRRSEKSIVLAGLLPDPQRYFDLHHTAADVFEEVAHRELKLGAAAMTGLVWLIAEHGLD